MAKVEITKLLSELISGLDKSAEESNGTKPATEGPRSSENTADIKRNVPGNAVDEAAAKQTFETSGVNAPTNDLGTKKVDADTKPNVTVKTTKDDPGTSHPAKVGGEKYASTKDIIAGSNDLLARIAVLSKSASAPKDTPVAVTKTLDASQPPAEAVKKDVSITNKDAVKAPVPTATKAASIEVKTPAKVPENKMTAEKAEKTLETESHPEQKKNEEAKMASVTIPLDAYTDIKNRADAWDHLQGYIEGQKQAEAVNANSIENEKVAQAIMTDAANALFAAEKAAEALVSYEQGLRDNTKKADDMAAAAAGAGAIDPAALAGAAQPPAPEAGGQPEISPELIAQLIQLLQEEKQEPQHADLAQMPTPEGGPDALDGARAATTGGDDSKVEDAPAEEASDEEKDQKLASAILNLIKSANSKPKKK